MEIKECWNENFPGNSCIEGLINKRKEFVGASSYRYTVIAVGNWSLELPRTRKRGGSFVGSSASTSRDYESGCLPLFLLVD
jgi:hypothetical protein